MILEEVSFHYAGGGGVKETSLKFQRNRIHVIIGPSGCGKSTLLRLINGMLIPQKGRVLIEGAPIDYKRLPELRRGIGYAVQGTGLFPHMDVLENVSLLARMEKWKTARINRRIHHLFELAGLSDAYGNRYPGELSGGEAQRVGLCRSLMLDPPILLLDEAFGALDPKTRLDVRKRFLKIQKEEPRTVIMITHDMDEAAKMGDHLIIMEPGRIKSKKGLR